MQNQTEYLNSIVRYLNNPQDEDLLSVLNSYRAQSADHEKYFHEVEKVWSLSSEANRLAEVSEAVAIERFKRELKPLSRRSPNYLKWSTAIAASLVFAVVGYWIYASKSSAELLTIETGARQDSVILADGSKVLLAANTVVAYPEKFDSDTREVRLVKGRAFFKITKDPKHPFKVDMGESVVSVLGTSFNIDYSEENIDLDVKTGRVMFSSYLNGTSSILIAGQALSYNIKKKEFTTRLSQNADSWLTGDLVFVDTPLEDVCKQLSAYYQLSIKLETHQQMVKKFNATFKHNSIDEVLEVLKVTYGLKIEKENKDIILKTP